MSEGKRYAVLHRFTDLSLLEGWDGLGMEMVAAADFDAKAAECERLRIEVDRLEAENARLAIDISEITKAAEVWLRRRNEIASQRDRLAAALRVARERLLDWAAYASADRTRLAQDLAAIDAALSPQETPK